MEFLKKTLITLPLTLLSASTFAAINSNYEVSSFTLSADHNESLGLPMPFYANARMQSKLTVTVAFTDDQGSAVTVSDDDLKGALSFYLQNDPGTNIPLDRNCSDWTDCWSYTYNENDYEHQIATMNLNAEKLPSSKMLSTPSNTLTAWLSSNEIAVSRNVCARIKFSGERTYDSCEFPFEENAIYKTIAEKIYSASDFVDLGEGVIAWEEENVDNFYFYKAEVRNFYLTAKDTSVTMTKVAMDNWDESNYDLEFLNDQWLGCYGNCPNEFKSVKGYIFEPGSKRMYSEEYVFNTAVGEGRTATWSVNDRLRSVTLSKLLYTSDTTATNDTQSEYLFTAFDQYGNKAPLKLTYPESTFPDQEWDYTQWNLVNQ